MSEEEQHALITKEQAISTGAAFLASGALDVASHFNSLALFATGAALFLAYRHGNDIFDHLRPGQHTNQAMAATAHFVDVVAARHEAEGAPDQSVPAKLRRLVGLRTPSKPQPKDADQSRVTLKKTEQLTVTQADEEEMEGLQPKQLPPMPKHAGDEEDDLRSLETVIQQSDDTLPGSCLFSTTLRRFKPSNERIFLGYLPGGQAVYVTMEDLCHVALAGLTGNGKTTLIRLLVSQLEYAGAKVLILNPHYTSYDIKKQEDWTPIERHLYRPPVTEFAAIGSVMKWVATVLLRERLEKYRQSVPWGSPIFVVIDELPAIVKQVPEFPEYVSAILREGRKVDILLIVASQDFLAKTVGPDEGGAVRKNYKTKMYVGGDMTTAKVLLDMPPAQIPENMLGSGVVMMKNQAVKTASLARVPYVDNNALYTLLGPSSYVATDVAVDDEDLDGLVEEFVSPHHDEPERQTDALPATTRRHVAMSAQEARRRQLEARRRAVYARQEERERVVATVPVAGANSLPAELQRAYEAFESQMSYRDLGDRLGVSKDTAGKWYKRLQDLGYITANGIKTV